jgi:gas vesicle protein
MEEKKTDYGLYLMSGFIGAIIGVIAAMLLEKSSEIEGSETHLTGKKLTRLGFGTISALWSLIEPGK